MSSKVQQIRRRMKAKSRLMAQLGNLVMRSRDTDTGKMGWQLDGGTSKSLPQRAVAMVPSVDI